MTKIISYFNLTYMLDPREYSPPDFVKIASTLGITESRSRRLLGAVVGSGIYDTARWQNLGIIRKDEKQALSELPRLTLIKRDTSPSDGFKKLLFETNDKYPVETVIIPLQKKGAVTLCLSSQVGCVMGCAFCATGRMAKRRNLKTWEIVDQFINARNITSSEGKRVTGAVFMGMGEPFLNYNSVMAAAQLLSFPVRNAISAKSITISTVGLVSEIDRFITEERPYRLSISLGAATDEKRAILVPVAAKTPIKEVIDRARLYTEKFKRRIMLAYVCVSNINMFEEDARALGNLIGDIPVRLDLIEVNDTLDRFKRPSENEFNIFRDHLRRYVKHPIVRRYSGGADINAACGTLAGGA